MFVRCLIFFITFELVRLIMSLMCKDADPATAICYGTALIIATMFMHNFDSIVSHDDSDKKEQ